MECKNCSAKLVVQNDYCPNCGAEVITKRITAKGLIKNFLVNNLGWDNRFLRTVKHLLVKPHVLISEYVEGTRKKYIAPFAFLAIGMTIAIFLFNTYDNEYIDLSTKSSVSINEWMAETVGGPYAKTKFQEEQLETNKKINRFTLKYFNILVVLFLPIYSFFTYLIYRKPFNYGEHIVFNCYIQGMSFLSISILFVLTLLTGSTIFFISNSLLLFIYYSVVLGKLHKLSIGQSILKSIIFIALLFALLMVIVVLGILVGIVISIFIK